MLELLHNKTAQGLATWVGLFSAAFAVLGKFTPEWFGQLTWPQSILIGIAAALLVSFVGAVTLSIWGYGFRLIRPLPLPTLPAQGANINKMDTDTSANLGARLRMTQDHITTLLERIEELEKLPGRAAETELDVSKLQDKANEQHAGLADLNSRVTIAEGALRSSADRIFGLKLLVDPARAMDALTKIAAEMDELASSVYGGEPPFWAFPPDPARPQQNDKIERFRELDAAACAIVEDCGLRQKIHIPSHAGTFTFHDPKRAMLGMHQQGGALLMQLRYDHFLLNEALKNQRDTISRD